MRSILTILASVALTVAAFADDNHPWQAPTQGDRRSACPLLNSLANHGFLPRNGLNLSSELVMQALSDSINLHHEAAEFPTAVALSTSTTGNPDTFNLDDINKHGVIEHDGSLSRADAYFGDNHSLNWTVWNETKSYFEGDTISVLEAAKARAARLRTSAATNPEYEVTDGDSQSSLFETAFLLLTFGDGNEAKTEWVRVFFEKERLPYAEGYVRRQTPITSEDLADVSDKLIAAT